jgi:glycosyltransferase involved in cell wall biosynthesis
MKVNPPKPGTGGLPLVSVVIPTFNRAGMLQEAIDSVLDQKSKDFELIVVDDGSTDGTCHILNRYKQRLRAVYQPNQGVSAARNTGIRMARGPWIAFLDSDDLWLPEKLSVQVDFFQSYPEALICQTEETWIRKKIRVNPGKRHQKRSGMIYEPSLELCLVSPSAVMIKKELFDLVGFFDEDLPACEDYDLWLRISARFPVHLIDRALIIKRGGHDDQLSKSPCLDKYRIQALEKMIQIGNLTEPQRLATRRVLAEKCRIYASGCEKRGRREEALLFLAKAGEL